MPTLSLAVIARDEAANLPALFASLEPLSCLAQKVVVDTGSRDGTADIARSLGAEVSAFAWNDDFAAARNAALEKCSGDFILWLDCDDRLPEETARRLPELLRENCAWRLVVLSPREDGSGDAFRQIRIFPNRKGLAFEGRIHEQLGTACARLGVPVRESDLEVLHTGYASPELRAAKAGRNLDLLRREAGEHPADATVAMALGNAFCQSGRFAEAKKTFAGWIPDAHWSRPPGDPVLRRFPCLLAEVCAQLGEPEAAERWDRLAMAWEPGHLLPGFRQGKRELERGKFPEALRLFLELAVRPVEIGILASDNASARRNALGYAALLDVQQRGFGRADEARRCLLALMEAGDPLPLDPLFPFEFFLKRGEDADACAYAEARLKRHPGDKALAEAFARHRREHRPPSAAPAAGFTALQKRLGTIAAPLAIPHKPGLSVVMIVKNEAKNIRAAVESFRPIADEIVVNDTGSSDGTQALLDALGVTWFQSDWQNDFSRARNQAVDKATRSWILWLDADDRIPESEYENFRKLKTAPLDRAFGFQIINTQGGLPLGGRFMQVRMFPNHPQLRFRYRVHEQIIHAVAELGLHCFYTETAVHHQGYEDPELKKKKARRNLDILFQEEDRLGEEPSLAMSVGDSYYILGQWEKGVEAYRRAMEIPHCREINADVYAELPACVGRGWQKMGRHDEALRWYARSRELDPGKIEPAYYEAECLMEMGRNPEAEAAFARVAEMPMTFSATTTQFDTVRIFSQWHRAELQVARGAETEAAATLRKLSRDYPQVLEAWHLLGKLLAKRGDNEEAALCFDKGAALNPGALETLHRDRLELLQKLGRREAFAKALELAKKFFPNAAWPAFGAWPNSLERPTSASPLLSLCLIVKNEMANLPACLESAEGLADEWVVVDTGSTDGTAEWAEGHGAKLIRSAWENDFSRARNRSLDAATGKWILWLDADDRLRPEDRAAIRSLVENAPAHQPPAKAFGFLVHNTGDGGKTGTVFNQIRLFPNRPDLRFTAPIHEQILPAIEKAGLEVEYLPIRILHTGYADPAAGKAKQVRNRALLETQIREGRGVTAVTHYTLGMACLDLDDCGAALGHFAEAAAAAQSAGANPHILAIAPVKSAVALAKMNRHEDALRKIDGAPEAARALPEALLVRAQLLAAMGRREEARAAFEQLLAIREHPTFTPVDFPFLKIQALRYLGEYWHAMGRRDLAVNLLKAGLAVKDGQDFGPQDLEKAYAASLSAANPAFA